MSVWMKPPGPWVPVTSGAVGRRCRRTVLNPVLIGPDVAAFLPPRLSFRPVDGGQDGQR